MVVLLRMGLHMFDDRQRGAIAAGGSSICFRAVEDLAQRRGRSVLPRLWDHRAKLVYGLRVRLADVVFLLRLWTGPLPTFCLILEAGDTLIDGRATSYSVDDISRAKGLAREGIHYAMSERAAACGDWNGAIAMMIGGENGGCSRLGSPILCHAGGPARGVRTHTGR